jgi:hypothetical protein
VIAILRYGFAA